MKIGPLLMILPLLFFIPTGFIYAGWQASQTQCLGNVGCTTNPQSNIPTNNPLYDALTGQYGRMFSSIQAVSFGNSTGYIPIPWVTNTTVATIQSFDLPNPSRTTYNIDNFPWLSYTTKSTGAWIVDTCSIFDFSCSFTIPAITIPWLNPATITVTVPWIDFGTPVTVCGSNSCKIPWVAFGATYNLPIPNLTYTLISTIIGGLMLFFGLGIGFKLFGSGVDINPRGSKTLTILGVMVLLWTFIGIFTGSWLFELGVWGTVIMAIFQLMFSVGGYLQFVD